MDENQREEWRRIGESERLRRKTLDDLRRVMQEEEVKTKKTANSLLRIVLHGERVSVNDAANMLGVDRSVIIGWARLLKSRKLILVEDGDTPNPVLKPKRELMEKLLVYKKNQVKQDFKKNIQESLRDLDKKKEELAKEHEMRILLEEALEKREADLRDKDKELQREVNLRIGLEDQLKAVEEQAKGGNTTELEELRTQLERERKERMRVEDLLRKEREELSKLLAEEAMMLREKKELEEGRSRTSIESINAAPNSINEFIDMLAARKTLRARDAATELGVGEVTIDDWTAKLSEKKAVEVKKHITGGNDIYLSINVDFIKLKAALEEDRRLEEIQRVRKESGEVR